MYFEEIQYENCIYFRGGSTIVDARQKDKNITGGKGANLAEMAVLIASASGVYDHHRGMCLLSKNQAALSDELKQASKALIHIENTVGKKFGNTTDPLLVSVRSGARVSMPGMMDTVLNLGLNDETVKGLALASGDERFAWDSYRRFIQMYGDVVLGLDHGMLEEALEIAKEERGLFADTELEADDWKAIVFEYKSIAETELGYPFPQDVNEQLWGAIRAVFDSWDSHRAKVYRRLNNISSEWGLR